MKLKILIATDPTKLEEAVNEFQMSRKTLFGKFATTLIAPGILQYTQAIYYEDIVHNPPKPKNESYR